MIALESESSQISGRILKMLIGTDRLKQRANTARLAQGQPIEQLQQGQEGAKSAQHWRHLKQHAEPIRHIKCPAHNQLNKSCKKRIFFSKTHATTTSRQP